MITVFLNNSSLHFSAGTSLLDLLQQQQLSELKGIALAINNSIIPRNNWAQHQLQNMDKIIVITASQGG